METVERATGALAPAPPRPTSLLDLADEVLFRIFEDLDALETGPDAPADSVIESSKPFPALDRYRGINRRLHHRIVSPIACRRLVIPQGVSISSSNAWDACLSPRIAALLQDHATAVEHLDWSLLPGQRAPHCCDKLLAPLLNLKTLRITGGVVLTPSLSLALRPLGRLRKLVLCIDPDVDRKVTDVQYKLDLGRSLPSVIDLTVSLVNVGMMWVPRHLWPIDDLGSVRTLDMDAAIQGHPGWPRMEVLCLRASPHISHLRLEWLAFALEKARGLSAQACGLHLKKLVIEAERANFFRFDSRSKFDEVLANLRHVPQVQDLEIRYGALFRCDGVLPAFDLPTIKRLCITETALPSCNRQSANLNGLDLLLDLFPRLESLHLTSHWLLPLTDAHDLGADPDPPTDLTLAYDAPQLAAQVIELRDETDVREFRYRRSEAASWELRWTREGGKGTQFEMSRWWV